MAKYLHDKFLRVPMGGKDWHFLDPKDVRFDNWPQPDLWERVNASLDTKVYKRRTDNRSVHQELSLRVTT